MTTLQVNGELFEVSADPEMPLLWVLRDILELKGTKFGCGVGRCGICTVLVDGKPKQSCMLPVRDVAGLSITTIEGLAQQNHPVVSAWVAEQVPQCGYCQGGQMISAAALLAKKRRPSDADINAALAGVLCRCGTYPRIRNAVRRAATNAAEPIAASRRPPDNGIALNDFVRVHADGSVTLVINHSEMGQGALTGLVALAAEELEIEFDRVHTIFAPADKRYKNPMWGQQFTGGSSSIRSEWEPLRRHAAAAREMLIAAAARKLGFQSSDCIAERGSIVHMPSSTRLNFGVLAAAALQEKPPQQIRLKSAADFAVLGRSIPRRDIPDIVTGRSIYGIDVTRSGMYVAVVARCPYFGGTLKSFDAEATRAIPGVRDVIALKHGVAVVADSFWTAQHGRAALRGEWHTGPHARLSSETVYAELDGALGRSGKRVRNVGKAKQVLKKHARTIEARYHTPFLAHATLEPMNCIADVRDDGCDVWVGTQNQEDTHRVAAEVSGRVKSLVRVHTQFMGGSFGRRLETDFVAEAVELSKQLHTPVQVVWDRADDLRHDKYRPAGAALLRAALDERGFPLAWLTRIAGSELVLEGVNVPYAIPNLREEHVEVACAVPTGPWRSVGASQNAFAVESFIDECAHAAKRDPFQYRRELLRDAPRHRAVLELAADKGWWGQPLAPGRGRGIATYHCFGSWIAQVAEVKVTGKEITVERVVCALDCGFAVNPDAVRAQIEGSIVQGLSAALKEEIRIAEGRVQQSTFEDYPILTLAETPRIEVYVIASTEPPGGVGEPAVPVIAPAVANAVFAATGTRLRRLPLRLDS